jgi:CarD family transcriptional regulator
VTATATGGGSKPRKTAARPTPTKPVRATKAVAPAPAAKVVAPVAAPMPAAAKEPALRAVKGGANPRPSMPPQPASIAPARKAEKEPEPKRVSSVVPRGYVPLVDIPKPPPPPSDFKLSVGDKAVHPSHGLAEVTAIEHREIGSMKGEFYILRIIDNGMRVMVPRASSSAAGIRPVMAAKEADRVLETMKAREVAVDLQPWSRRFRAYTEMIKSGSPHEVAKVLRDMYRLKFDKDLSFGERRLLDQAKSLLMKELAAAKGVAESILQAQVDEMFRA